MFKEIESSNNEIKYRFDEGNPNDRRILKTIEKLILKQPACWNCQNFYYVGCFDGYMGSKCKIHGNLECLDNPHFDCDGSKCPDYQRITVSKK